MEDPQALAELLRWYAAMGVDEAIGEIPIDRLAPPPPAPPVVALASAVVATIPPPAARASDPSALSARLLAERATTLAELRAAIAGFEGCALKRTATTTVVADGEAGAEVMVIGEAPGADEDRLGHPFVGRSGQLLDRMLALIGLDRRRNAYITNVLFWRPPANRKPTEEEVAACLPFVWRQIALVAPKLVMLAGGTPASALLGRSEGIMRLRGKWFDLAVPGLAAPVPTIATFHPSFLLRSPTRKGEAWRDLLAVQSRLESP